MRVTVELCRDCHTAGHKDVPKEKDLGRNYYTLEKLLAHPEISKYVEWVKKQR